MKQTFLFCCALLLLVTSCQSTRTAFQFRSAPTAISQPVVNTEAPAAEAPVPQPAILPQTKRLTLPATVRRAPARRISPFRQLTVPLRSASAAASVSASTFKKAAGHQRPHQAQLEHTAAFILGVALVAGGVVGGILLGGWLGLGVGALVVLLGYYFLGVGIGGKHAWLEVFQEFFNM